jgi:hypothetical protein
MPRPPREVVFTIDGNDIQLGQSWQNFNFEANVQNNTVPNCYFSRLKISPVHEDDQSRQIVLKLQNQFGLKHITVSLADLLGVDGSDIGGVPAWLVILLSVIAVGLCLVGCVVFCMKRHMLCFDGVKSSQSHYSDDKLKVGPTIHEPYIDDSPRVLFGGSTGGGEVMREQIYVSREAVV